MAYRDLWDLLVKALGCAAHCCLGLKASPTLKFSFVGPNGENCTGIT